MAPRSYSLGKRAAAVEDTQRRILAAIVALHAERGVAGTTAADVAARAGVAVATVTRYFASVDAMVHACGAHLRTIAPMPQTAIFDGVDGDDRVRLMFDRCYAWHAGLAPWGRKARADAGRVPALDRALTHMQHQLEEVVRTALAPFRLPGDVVRVAVALASAPYWQSLHDAGVPIATTAQCSSDMLLAWVRRVAVTSEKE